MLHPHTNIQHKSHMCTEQSTPVAVEMKLLGNEPLYAASLLRLSLTMLRACEFGVESDNLNIYVLVYYEFISCQGAVLAYFLNPIFDQLVSHCV